MSLKQSIVIANEFTYKQRGGHGTRGSSPGRYVMQYMAREDAVEALPPNVAAAVAGPGTVSYPKPSQADGPRMRMRRRRTKDGVGFGNDSVSLTEQELSDRSDQIQRDYDQGKTVLKTVLSFEEGWLKERGIIDPDFSVEKPGDLRGHVDQLKLRLAIVHGLDRMGQSFDDLRYVGVIQVDRKHLHVHLSMVDHGVGYRMADGSQRGVLTEKHKRVLRRGIDEYLDEKQVVKSLFRSAEHTRQNTVCYVKALAHQTVAQRGFSQFLLATLPKNRNWWRASSRRKEMCRPNALLKEYVSRLLERPDSGYREAMAGVTRYARQRQEREGLSIQEYQRLVRMGQQQLMDDCLNAVYGLLRQIPPEDFSVSTPTLSAMASNLEEMAAQAPRDPLSEFSLKLRTYSFRLDFHRKEYHRMQEEYQGYLRSPHKSKDAAPLGEFLRIETDYQMQLMVKYQYFLSFLPPSARIQEQFEELEEEKERLRQLERMRDDDQWKQMSWEAGEAYLRKTYQESRPQALVRQPEQAALRVERQAARIAALTDAFREVLLDYGMDYDGHGILQKKRYPFAEVKALDLHHMTYDFPYDCMISKGNADRFAAVAARRYQAFLGAKDYLVRSHQQDAVSLLPEQDVLSMKAFADQLGATGTIMSSRSGQEKVRPAVRTVSLDRNDIARIDRVVRQTVEQAALARSEEVPGVR